MDLPYTHAHSNQFHVFDSKSIKEFNLNIPEQRLRSLDKKTVRDIADSIKRVGLLVPIVFTDNGKDDPRDMTLVAGLHRFEAMKLVWAEAGDDAREFPLPYRLVALRGDKAGPDRKMVEITENLHRKELSREERLAAAAMWSKEGFRASGPKPASPQGGRPANLFRTWERETGISHGTSRRRWDAFCDANGQAIDTDKATPEEFQHFLDWLAADTAAAIAAKQPTTTPRKVPVQTPEQVARDNTILRLHGEGKTLQEITKEAGIKSVSTVHGVLKKAGKTSTRMARAPQPVPAAVPQLRVVTSSAMPETELERDWHTAFMTIRDTVHEYRLKGIDVDADLRRLLTA